MIGVDFAVGPSYEVVIAGDPRAVDTGRLLRAIRHEYTPNKVVILVPAGPDSSAIERIAPYTSRYSTIDGKAAAYVCVGHVCDLPTTDVDVMLASLSAG